MLTTVDTVGHTESKLEVECLEACIVEEVSLDHTEILNFFVHSKFYPIGISTLLCEVSKFHSKATSVQYCTID